MLLATKHILSGWYFWFASHSPFYWFPKHMAAEIQSAGQAGDAMLSFSISPPEILWVDNSEKYCSSFVYEPQRKKLQTWSKCFARRHTNPGSKHDGRWDYVQELPTTFECFWRTTLTQNTQKLFDIIRKYHNWSTSTTTLKLFMSHKKKLWKRNAEAVFSNVNPKRTIDNLVSFVLRFDQYAFQLDLFGKLISRLFRASHNFTIVNYNHEDLMISLSLYVRQRWLSSRLDHFRFPLKCFLPHPPFLRCSKWNVLSDLKNQ